MIFVYLLCRLKVSLKLSQSHFSTLKKLQILDQASLSCGLHRKANFPQLFSRIIIVCGLTKEQWPSQVCALLWKLCPGHRRSANL